MRILHFADAHIDMANFGRHDPASGLPIRVLDFLKSLDIIINTAITEQVNLVIFAGDAYKDRAPAPTFQREWEKRILRLSQAGIPTILLVGNHDNSSAQGRAHSIQEFETLQVPHIHVVSIPCLLTSDQLERPLQVIAIPWLSRSAFGASLGLSTDQSTEIYDQMEARLTTKIKELLTEVDSTLPVILTAHASVQGAQYGAERMIMLGTELVLPGSLVKDPHFDYVALGHLHKAQNLNEGQHPPVVYPGSIERVDFGEVKDDKFFVIADVQRGKTTVDWRKLDQIRKIYDCFANLNSQENVTATLLAALPARDKLKDAIVRLTIKYHRDWETLIDDQALREYCQEALDFHINRKPDFKNRARLPEDQSINSLTPLELLNIYWLSQKIKPDQIKSLISLADNLINSDDQPDED